MTRPAIIRLLLLRRPSHIARLVMSVVIDAIYRMLHRWAQANMCQKRGKRMSPQQTDTNTSAAIVFETDIGRLCTAFFYTFPTAIFGRIVATVREMSDSRIFPLPTSARLTITSAQVATGDSLKGSAVALAPPFVVTCRRFAVWGNHEITPESLMQQVGFVIRHTCSLPRLER